MDGLDIGEHGNAAYPDFAQSIPGGFHSMSGGGTGATVAQTAYATQMSTHGAR